MKSFTVWFTLAACLAAVSPRAAEPDKNNTKDKETIQPSTWRPFKELPEVLYYEGFERNVVGYEHGKVVSEDPLPRNGHGWKLESNKDEAFVFLKLEKTPVKIPQGFNPAQIYIQFSLYTEEAGTVAMKFIHANGDYSREVPVPKIKTWTSIMMKLADARNKDAHPEIDHLLKDFEIHVKPMKNHKDQPKAYIDDVVFTYNVKPDDLRPRLLLAEKKRLDMERMAERDGYVYSMPLNDFLKTSLKAAKVRVKAKHVVVMGATPELTKTWAGVMTKLKENGYVFEAAEEPGAKPVGGMDDMRLLLPYALQKEPEMALLFVGPDEVLAPGRPADKLRVIIQRTLEAGVVPVVCVPAPEKKEPEKAEPPKADAPKAEKDKFEKDKQEREKQEKERQEKFAAFAKSAEELCTQYGAPMVDASFLWRNAKGEIDPAKAPNATPEKLALLAMTALKHVHDSLAMKD
ncbi:MAG TPA: hypothetical protein VKX17_10895 [Planctomycetota bacterium]|nr:hypothetical protein [Planctomycetota bacterium]